MALESPCSRRTFIEDAACAAGAMYQGKHAGSLGVAACLAFIPVSPLRRGKGDDNDQ